MFSPDSTVKCTPMGTAAYEVKARARATSDRWVRLLMTAMMLGASLALQWSSQAAFSELGGHPDESAHYVTGLLVHDYLIQHDPISPIAFVSQFYGHYPKVGLGHWPPVFYLLQSLWSLLFQSSVASILALVALLSALCASLIALSVARTQTWTVGLMAGLLFVASRVVAQSSAMIMPDGLVALLMLAATLAFVRFMDSTGSAKLSLLFGLLTTLAFLTKGSALALVVVPPVAIVISKRWNLLARKSLWLAPLMVLCLCAPWYWFTRDMAVGTWVYPTPRFVYAADALRFYSHAVYLALGPLGTVLAAIGLVHFVATQRTSDPSRSNVATGLFALLTGVAAVVMIVPVGFEVRFIIPALPPLVFFAAGGGLWVAARIGNHLPSGERYEKALCAGFLAVAVILCFKPVHKQYSGFSAVADAILNSPSPSYPSVLIVSDAAGEGMFVADMASHRSESPSIVLRGTKILADTNWLGTDYRSLFRSPRELVDRLEELPITYVVEDHSVKSVAIFQHQKLLDQAIAGYPAFFQRLGVFDAIRDGVRYHDSLQLYGFIHTSPPARVIRLPMLRMLHSEVKVVVPASRR